MTSTWANDPCGMVPPIYTGKGKPIQRIGLQQTYVFFRDGVETFVIRPGFQGNVDEFGMLIPFPNPPALRKVADDVFPHLAAAVDPPEVVINLFPYDDEDFMQANQAPTQQSELSLKKSNEVRVIKQEAVGMYEVAVLEAGSAAALKRWIDAHGYQYPKGMDAVANDYVKLGWCFVAVKTKVGQKSGANPLAGQRRAKTTVPAGSTFDGHVQAMGFRFQSDELVVPMRLSAFNDGELRNVVYLLTDGPKKIRAIPEEYVVRQLTGKQLLSNVTHPLPLRIIGGTEKDLKEWHLKDLKQRRDPEAANGIARELFASDLLAVERDDLSLRHEEDEKELLRIGEHFGLRGPEIDRRNAAVTASKRKAVTEAGLKRLSEMTLTVVDGDFPREVLAKQNLTFAEYRMPSRRNNPRTYDAKINGPAEKKQGILRTGSLEWRQIERLQMQAQTPKRVVGQIIPPAIIGLVLLIGMVAWRTNRQQR